MNVYPLDYMFLKFFVVFTCFFYWFRVFIRRAVREQQPKFYRERER